MKSIVKLLTFAVLIVSLPALGQDTSKVKHKHDAAVTAKTKYTCPMHPDVVMNKPGKCAKCGMDLTATPKEKMKKEVMKKYSCPMHADETSNSPGKCAKCGMDLTATPKEKMKKEVMKKYSCPMHPDETSDKPGKCSKCKMELTEVKDMHNNH